MRFDSVGTEMVAPAARRQPRLRSDLLWFIGLRVFSGALSFSLFALLARCIAEPRAKPGLALPGAIVNHDGKPI